LKDKIDKHESNADEFKTKLKIFENEKNKHLENLQNEKDKKHRKKWNKF